MLCFCCLWKHESQIVHLGLWGRATIYESDVSTSACLPASPHIRHINFGLHQEVWIMTKFNDLSNHQLWFFFRGEDDRNLLARHLFYFMCLCVWNWFRFVFNCIFLFKFNYDFTSLSADLSNWSRWFTCYLWTSTFRSFIVF